MSQREQTAANRLAERITTYDGLTFEDGMNEARHAVSFFSALLSLPAPSMVRLLLINRSGRIGVRGHILKAPSGGETEPLSLEDTDELTRAGPDVKTSIG